MYNINVGAILLSIYIQVYTYNIYYISSSNYI